VVGESAEVAATDSKELHDGWSEEQEAFAQPHAPAKQTLRSYKYVTARWKLGEASFK